MTIREILNTTEHRPWEMPTESWKFYQEWNSAIFLHWQDGEDMVFVTRYLQLQRQVL